MIQLNYLIRMYQSSRRRYYHHKQIQIAENPHILPDPVRGRHATYISLSGTGGHDPDRCPYENA